MLSDSKLRLCRGTSERVEGFVGGETTGILAGWSFVFVPLGRLRDTCVWEVALEQSGVSPNASL